MGPPGAMGGRALFNGDGGKLIVPYLLYGVLPFASTYIVGLILSGIGSAIDKAVRADGLIAGLFGLASVTIIFAGALIAQVLLLHKLLEFYFNNLTLEGQPCRYVGTVSEVFKAQFVNVLLTQITLGLYAPWAYCNILRWAYENTEVGGQRGRLSFQGEGSSLFGTFLLGIILTYCTFYIYGAWFANDLLAFGWENTRIDGRTFSFRKDPGGFLGQYIINILLVICTLGIYYPWMIANMTKWSTDRVA